MIIPFQGQTPRIDPAAWIAPNATLAGDVTIGPGARVLFGAQLIAEGGAIHVGAGCVVMHNAVLRSTPGHDLWIGDHCVIGPQSHLVGCRLEGEVFVATGAAVFHGAVIGRGSEVRIHAVVHVNTTLDAGATVPIGWVAVGTPAQILPPDRHDAIWAVQAPLNFPLTAYGIPREQADMPGIAGALAARYDATAMIEPPGW